MLTADCPVSLRKVRWAARRRWGILLGSLAAVIALFVAATERRNTGGRMQRVEPFASLFAWLDPPAPAPPLAKQPDSLDKGWRLGW
jgi:hypothetical protein